MKGDFVGCLAVDREIMVYATDDDARGWLKTHKQKQKEVQEWDEEFQKRSSTIARATKYKAGEPKCIAGPFLCCGVHWLLLLLLLLLLRVHACREAKG